MPAGSQPAGEGSAPAARAAQARRSGRHSKRRAKTSWPERTASQPPMVRIAQPPASARLVVEAALPPGMPVEEGLRCFETAAVMAVLRRLEHMAMAGPPGCAPRPGWRGIGDSQRAEVIFGGRGLFA